MTFRERLADWISGGKLTEAHEEIGALSRKVKSLDAAFIEVDVALMLIADATDGIQSGTARKINRMAREALK